MNWCVPLYPALQSENLSLMTKKGDTHYVYLKRKWVRATSL